MKLKDLLPLITEDNRKLYWAFGLVAGFWTISLIISGVIWVVSQKVSPNTADKPLSAPKIEFKKFKSDSEFRNYLAKAASDTPIYDATIGGITPRSLSLEKQALPAELPQSNKYSQTNVQVIGIDEPDIIKTNGKEIFFSQEEMPYILMERSVNPSIMPPIERKSGKVKIANLDPELLQEMDTTGELLLHDGNLVILQNQRIVGYDVSNPETPQKRWEYSYENNSTKISARLLKGKVIVITQTPVYSNSPCPIPLIKGESAITIPCSDIHYWDTSSSAQTTFTAIKINAATGSIEEKVSWLGNASLTTIYMSPENLYIGHYSIKSESTLLPEFLTTDPGSLLDSDTKQRIEAVSRLTISDRAKVVEIEEILASYRAQFNDDKRLQWQTEFSNAYAEFKREQARHIEKTSLTKINFDSLGIQATGSVPGKLLNQFSMDEYGDHLRLATTIGNLWETGRKSINDVYILNQKLEEVGKVTGLGRDERIYGVRFMGNRGYVVTFRETDPLYVLDLTHESQPRVTGELKIPGYSSYLHPLNDTLILGVGREDNKIKLAIYDVNDPANPLETTKYLIDEYWSEAVQNHHAFLHNPDTNTFFLPGSKGAYFFTWDSTSLKLTSAIADTQIKRAVYVDTNWYVAGENNLTAISGTTWKRLNTLSW